MSITFTCPCGRRYNVAASLAGRKVQCKSCGVKLRIPLPRPTAPAKVVETDLGIEFDDDLEAGDAVSEPPLAPRPRATPEPAAKPKGKPRSKGARALRGLRDALPRDEELRYPVFGAVVLGLTIVLAMTGGSLALILFLFVALAASVTALWAAISGLTAAWKQGVGSTLTLLLALAATGVFQQRLTAPDSTFLGLLFTAVVALLLHGSLFFQHKRAQDYRHPLALGLMALLLFAAFAIGLRVVRLNLNREITPDSIAQSLPPPPSAPGVAPTHTPARDSVSVALDEKRTLNEARAGFRSRPIPRIHPRTPLDVPPPGVFSLVKYPAAVGELSAYLTPDPGDGRKRPAIVWITGGDCNTLGDVWSPADPSNDQTAAAYRQAGIVMMFPSLRGGNQNPGENESFLGEVDDILAAADFLSKQEYVDPQRIYLGGHSTGGTLVLLVAESTDRFRAVFSFGPADDIRGYGPDYSPFGDNELREVAVRSPGYWLHSVRCPTFVFEGTNGNIQSLRKMRSNSQNPRIQFHEIPGGDHFGILAPLNQRIATRILNDVGPRTNLSFSPQDLN